MSMSADTPGGGRDRHGDQSAERSLGSREVLRSLAPPGCGRDRPAPQSAERPGGGMAHAAKDPVCGMDVDAHTTAHRATLDGRSYYFCSSGCRERFLASPATYLNR